METKKRKQGFSLVELLIVIGIIAVLGGVMLTQFSGSTDSALAATCLNNMRALSTAVLMRAQSDGRYPAAGPFQYYDTDTLEKKWEQGWIGHASVDGENKVSCYYDPGSEGSDQHFAITNGTVWRAAGGQRGAYVCPAHVKYCTRNKHPTPAWSFAMNSFFGWDRSVAGRLDFGLRSYGKGLLEVKYKSGRTNRKRSPEKVLLFAEIPYVDNGVQKPEWSTSASEYNDQILKYAAGGDENDKANRASDGDGEVIGFNHKSGNQYSAHVAFADGHCTKIIMPENASEDNLRQLTTWLCTGRDYTFNGRTYGEVAE